MALTPEVAAAADALLAQLAIDTRKQGLQVPELLASKGRVAVAVAIAMVLLVGVTLGVMTVLGALLR